jgi:hypothetical protein
MQSIIAHTIYQTDTVNTMNGVNILFSDTVIQSYAKFYLLVTSHPWFPNLVGIRLRVRRTLQNLYKDFPDGHGCESSKKIVRDQWDVGQF